MTDSPKSPVMCVPSVTAVTNPLPSRTNCVGSTTFVDPPVS